MYHPQIVEKRVGILTDKIRRTTHPGFSFTRYTPDEVSERVEALTGIWDEEKVALKRPLTLEEERFIFNETVLAKIDAEYWMTRYAYIKTKLQTLVRINFFEAQHILYRAIQEAELEAVEGRSGDGVILAVLKARQLGASTLSEALLSHRVFFYGNTTALIVGDVEEQSSYLFDMMERIYVNLPWWMRPERTYHVKDKQMYFEDQDSLILVEAARSTRGSNTFGRARGMIGEGKTVPLFHGSELAMWTNADQIDGSLMPAIPNHARTLAIFESTAKGRGNWWHHAWLAARKGLGRRRPVFIPWYAETQTYSRPAPIDWMPSPVAIAHAAKVAETSPRWMRKTVHLTRDQLYWWESERADYMERRKISEFLAAFTADDLEAFQNTTTSVFPSELIHEMRQAAKVPGAIVEFVPRSVA